MSKNSFVTLATFLVVVVGFWLAITWVKKFLSPSSVSMISDVESHGHTVVTLGGSSQPINRHANPKNDSWPTEAAHQAIKKQLAQIANIVQKGELERLAEFATTSFSGQSITDDALTIAYEDDRFQVLRFNRERNASAVQSLKSVFAGHVLEQSGRLDPSSRIAFKVTSIDSAGDQVSTNVLVEAFSGYGSRTQVTANWICRWISTNEKPLLQSVSIDEFERVKILGDAKKSLFEDVTRSVMGHVAGYEKHFLRDTTFWSQRLTGVDDMHIYGHNGIAIADVNNDGLDDLYVCDSGGLPNRLFLQNANGTVRDHSKASGIDWLESTSSALLVDLDNDGDQDLVCATVAAILFASNDGKGVFKIRNAYRDVPEAHSMCAADYDNDGDIDIYVCNYGPSGAPGGQRGFEAALPVPYEDANNGGANVLLSNVGNFKFENVTKSVGLDENNRRFSFAAAWQDFDLDGDADLYVANDFGRNNLYRNDEGRFSDMASQAAVEDTAAGMSVSWGDFNRDGRPDLYVGNMFSSAGKRVTYQRKFTGLHLDRSVAFQRMARGNTLFAANDDLTFSDVTEVANVNMGRWAWSSKFADVNNDGWPDLIVANGYFTNENPDDL